MLILALILPHLLASLRVVLCRDQHSALQLAQLPYSRITALKVD